MVRTRQGKTYTWQLSDSPIGSGDAGEVFAVTCLENPDLQGMMKTPARIATSGTIQRQARQIAQESLALALLDGIPDGKAHPPRLLDEAPEFTRNTANYFIVSETAPGEDLSSMLTQSRKTGKPFPRRVIITVLDALFDLFARAHRSGVLWNDVKLDHIYWHNPTSSISVIDWGNALFLDRQAEGGRPTPPRWEDYQQMVETLSDFLQRTAPELFTDLGWDEFEGRKLSSTQVSVLARRIAYQQQVVKLKEMEYQSLMRVVLSHEPSKAGLQKISSYQRILEQIGAPWDREGTLQYAQNLVETTAMENEVQTSIQATALLWEMFDDALDLPWHLVREYFRNTDLLTDPSLGLLVHYSLQSNYASALWSLASIAQRGNVPSWWSKLVPVLRQKALGTVIPSPYQLCQSAIQHLQAKNSQDSQLLKLARILDGWRDKGKESGESPFEYKILEVVRKDSSLPQRMQFDFKQSFAAGKEMMRGLFQAWVDLDWDELPKAFQKVINWDPDRWGLLSLAEKTNQFQLWLDQLYAGPDSQTDPGLFMDRMLETRPTIEQVLGRPPWFRALMTMLTAVSQGETIADYKSEVQKWSPWLLQYPRIQKEKRQTSPIDATALEDVLSHFVKHLKTWGDWEGSLREVNEQAPAFTGECKRLAIGFDSVLSLVQPPDPLSTLNLTPSHPALQEVAVILQALSEWRTTLSAGDLETARQIVSDPSYQEWQILAHALQETADWQTRVLPLLHSLQTRCPLTGIPEGIDPLSEVSNTISDLQAYWRQIYHSGVNQELLDNLEQNIKKAEREFLSWRQSFEHTGDRVARLLYHSFLQQSRQLAELFFKLTQHIRQANFSFTLLEKAKSMKTTIRFTSLENLLDHLSAIEEMLVIQKDERQFPEWQNSFQEIQIEKDPVKRQQMVLSLPDSHPLYAWLVQSQFE